MVGPFILTDFAGPDDLTAGTPGADIDAHPHIGLSTLTYLFEGRVVHRDSTGALQDLDAGAVNWMTAGSGVTHSERTHPADLQRHRRINLLQAWVALPDHAEETEPTFSHHAAGDIPHSTLASSNGSAQVRLLAGTGWGLESPVPVHAPLVLAEVTLSDDASILLDDVHPERAVVCLSGEISVGGQSLSTRHMAVIRPGSQPQVAGEGQILVLGGEPVGQRYIWWNFVHSDRDRLEEAKADWAAQRFPRIPDDHDVWVPLPGR
jgi:redox-sensitive bicupin YhaK (pirin superfamily)